MNRISTIQEDIATVNMSAEINDDILHIPTPDVKIMTYLNSMGAVLIDKKDHVLSRVKVPHGWHIVHNKNDSRHMTINDVDGKIVLKMFLKNTGYDYYGNSFI
jgi:hypothetical protein